MHVDRVIIRNFRGIERADLRFQPGLNLLVGRNGSGKSTVLAALRILLDATLGRQARSLDDSDIYGNEKFSGPANVVIAARLANFGDTPREKYLRLRMRAEDGHVSQWLLYRFRPRFEVRIALNDKEIRPTDLTVKHYEAERLIGVVEDPSNLEWDVDSGGDELKDKDLSSIFVEEIPALRNVVEELRRQRTSPLVELLESVEVPEAEKRRVEIAYEEAQKAMESVAALFDIAKAISTSYELLTLEGQIAVRLGLSRLGYAAIVQDLGVYLTDDRIADMEVRRNGLGYNNLLYIAMILENFRRRVSNNEGSPLLLAEEPEAHLHPQAQDALLRSIASQPFQTIATTHSPYVVMAAGIRSIINLDRNDDVNGLNVIEAADISSRELADLERFMTADRGTILFATVVMLVEGPSEQLLVSAYASVNGYDLSKLGIQICAVNGTHFGVFEKLLGASGLNRPFLVVRDGDQHNVPGGAKAPVFDDGADISEGPNEFVTATTLEYAITSSASLDALAEVFGELGMPKAQRALQEEDVTGALQLEVLRGSVRAGKARFAQLFAERIVRDNLPAPPYLQRAIDAAVAMAADPNASNGL